jgi:hypothetical protein
MPLMGDWKLPVSGNWDVVVCGTGRAKRGPT